MGPFRPQPCATSGKRSEVRARWLELSRRLRDNRRVVAGRRENVGREDELAALVASLERARRVPRDIVLEGVAGIGKTTLWRQAVAEARVQGFRVLVCSP